jgi:hypothetical protein
MSEHVRAGGSRIHRIIACPGSLQAPDSSAGPAAAKGTTAHHVGERCIMTGCNADHPSFLGQTVMGVLVDRAMVDGVQQYVDWVRSIIDPLTAANTPFELRVEQSVDWSPLEPPEPMRGSADVVIVIPSQELMIVGDYKNGTEYVDHVGNKQLRYYALGALVSLPRKLTKHVKRVQMAIIQPNVPWSPTNTVVRTETIDAMELLDFAEDAMAAVRIGQQPDAPRSPGKHCKYCSLAGNCSARAQHSVVEAQSEFEVVTDMQADVSVIGVELLGEMVAKAEDIIERAQAWVKDAKQRLENELKAGTDVPGWKMVAKRAERVWNDEMAVEVWAAEQKLKTDDIYAPRVLKSPAQMEAVVGKKNLPADLYAKVSSGFNLARTTSSRPAVGLSAGDEFNAVQP